MSKTADPKVMLETEFSKGHRIAYELLNDLSRKAGVKVTDHEELKAWIDKLPEPS